jgi:quinol monooxygenase YgiN
MAAATRADAGCVSYTFAADVEDPDRVLGIEVWADRAALDAHMRHTHTRAFRAAHRGLVAGEPVMTFYDVDVPREDAAPA